MKVFVYFATLASADETDTLLQSNRLHQNQNDEPVDAPDDDEGVEFQDDDEGVDFQPRGPPGDWHPCSFNGEAFVNMKEDCTNQDFFVWKGGEKEGYVDPTYPPHVYGADMHWETLPANATGGWETLCVAYVKTKLHGGTCKQWCEDQSTPEQQMVCNKGMDDAHWQTNNLYQWMDTPENPARPTKCTLFPSGADRPSPKNNQTENGCNARWDTQICGCAKVRVPTDPDAAPRLCSWKKSAPGLPKKALEDCTYGDYQIWKGGKAAAFVAPSYPPTMYGSDALWTTKEGMASRDGPFPGACVAYAETKGTCEAFCKKEGMKCVGGMDDAHNQRESLLAWQTEQGFKDSSCTLFPTGHDRQTQENNGCNQRWKTQICACQ